MERLTYVLHLRIGQHKLCQDTEHRVTELLQRPLRLVVAMRRAEVKDTSEPLCL
jgi:hypothetical protein